MTRALALCLVLACSSKPEEKQPWLTDEAAAFARARETGKAVVVDITVTWSVPSVELSTLLDKLQGELAPHFVPLRLDISDGDDRHAEVQQRYLATTLPAVVFVAADGTVLERVNVLLEEPALREVIARAAAKRAK